MQYVMTVKTDQMFDGIDYPSYGLFDLEDRSIQALQRRIEHAQALKKAEPLDFLNIRWVSPTTVQWFNLTDAGYASPLAELLGTLDDENEILAVPPDLAIQPGWLDCSRTDLDTVVIDEYDFYFKSADHYQGFYLMGPQLALGWLQGIAPKEAAGV